MLPGFHLGVLNPLLPALAADLSLSESGKSLIFSILILAAAGGALGAGKVRERKCLCVPCSSEPRPEPTIYCAFKEGGFHVIICAAGRQTWSYQGSRSHGSTLHNRRVHVHHCFGTGTPSCDDNWAASGRPWCAHPSVTRAWMPRSVHSMTACVFGIQFSLLFKAG